MQTISEYNGHTDIFIRRITDGVVTYATWKNIGGGQFARVSDTSTGLFCNPKGVFWVDLNGQ